MKLFPVKSPRLHLGLIREDKHLLNANLPRLSKQEMKELEQMWPSLDFYQIDLLWNMANKKVNGFSPFYLGAIQANTVRCAYNPRNQLVSLENKALCDVWFPEIPFPEVYVRCLDGVFYDRKMNVLTIENAINILESKSEFVIKPSVDTLCGAGVKKIKAETTEMGGVRKVVSEAGKNFIAQAVLQQEPTISSLNPSSVNCLRITSLYINGKFDFSPMIKIGKKGSHVDNWHSSYLVGMSKKGELYDTGYDKQLNVVHTSDNGISFSGLKVPGFDKMIEMVEKSHKHYFPHCGIIGWDIICNAECNPVVVEVNLSVPGLVGEQLVSGAFLEPFVSDINEKLKKS